MTSMQLFASLTSFNSVKENFYAATAFQNLKCSNVCCSIIIVHFHAIVSSESFSNIIRIRAMVRLAPCNFFYVSTVRCYKVTSIIYMGCRSWQENDPKL